MHRGYSGSGPEQWERRLHRGVLAADEHDVLAETAMGLVEVMADVGQGFPF